MSLFHTLAKLEGSDDLHMARLLLLLNAYAGSEGSGTVDGLTKLAKLDFLLRYPVYLERALKARRASPEDAHVAEHERLSIESRMVRFRYGPWDHRYRRFINILVARGLAQVISDGRTIKVGLTSAGVNAAILLAADESFRDMSQRARLLRRHFNMRATELMRFIYLTFPELETLSFNEEIG